MLIRTLDGDSRSREWLPTTLQAPTLNLNGSSAESLISQHQQVLDHLQAAQAAMHPIFPHGRDWQTEPPSDFYAAQREAQRRIDVIEEIIGEFTAIRDSLVEQKARRA